MLLKDERQVDCLRRHTRPCAPDGEIVGVLIGVVVGDSHGRCPRADNSLLSAEVRAKLVRVLDALQPLLPSTPKYQVGVS